MVLRKIKFVLLYVTALVSANVLTALFIVSRSVMALAFYMGKVD